MAPIAMNSPEALSPRKKSVAPPADRKRQRQRRREKPGAHGQALAAARDFEERQKAENQPAVHQVGGTVRDAEEGEAGCSDDRVGRQSPGLGDVVEEARDSAVAQGVAHGNALVQPAHVVDKWGAGQTETVERPLQHYESVDDRRYAGQDEHRAGGEIAASLPLKVAHSLQVKSMA